MVKLLSDLEELNINLYDVPVGSCGSMRYTSPNGTASHEQSVIRLETRINDTDIGKNVIT